MAELWRRGSVLGSWLLDLTAHALQSDHYLKQFSDRVSDSGEGRWISIAAFFSRFTSRGEADYGDKLLSAVSFEFGGHHEKRLRDVRAAFYLAQFKRLCKKSLYCPTKPVSPFNTRIHHARNRSRLLR